jgi:hypothetical protein
MIVLLSSYAVAAIPQTEVQQTETTNQIVIGAQDVITASDAGGGYLSSRDLLVMAVIGVGVLVLALVIL